MKPQFKATSEGFVITDPIERLQYQITTGTPVKPKPTEDDRIPYPTDSAVTIITGELTLPDERSIYIRYSDGTLYTDVHPNEGTSLPPNEYILDLSGPLKVYTYAESTVQISYDSVRSQTNIVFEDTTELVMSARSLHTRPAETVVTTADPTDVMQAVSTFGSELKTTATERSYPTLRGHPPSIKLSDELSIPDGIERPQTGIQIEIPPTLPHIFVVTPLAYYLAAKVVPGPKPQIVTEAGSRYSLNGENGFETTVQQVLKQVFLLDCIVRTEGESPGPLRERQKLESEFEFDIQELYGKSLGEQLETYLEIPFATIEPQLPEWYPEVHICPTENHIKFLPFISYDLTNIKVRNNPYGTIASRETSVQIPSTDIQISDYCYQNEERHDLSIPTIQQFWRSSNGTEVTSTKPLSAFQNSITQSPRDGPLSIEVICNDPKMSDELVTVNSIYGDQYEVPFDITIHHNLSRASLREVLAKESDFVHYIGHIDTDGFRCSDGTVDATAIETVGMKAFFLNACHSYKQGLGLITAGSIGGIVTQTEIQNSVAATIGSTIARLLNNGYSLYAALSIVLKNREKEDNYHIIGDGKVVVSHKVADTPILCEIVQTSDQEYNIKLTSYLSSKYRYGGIFTPYIPSIDSYNSVPGEIKFQSVPKPHLVEFLNKETFPVLFGNELRWSTEIKTSEL